MIQPLICEQNVQFCFSAWTSLFLRLSEFLSLIFLCRLHRNLCTFHMFLNSLHRNLCKQKLKKWIFLPKRHSFGLRMLLNFFLHILINIYILEFWETYLIQKDDFFGWKSIFSIFAYTGFCVGYSETCVGCTSFCVAFTGFCV